jgi:hypothetical protein
MSSVIEACLEHDRSRNVITAKAFTSRGLNLDAGSLAIQTVFDLIPSQFQVLGGA